MFYALRAVGLTIRQRRCVWICIERTKFPLQFLKKEKSLELQYFLI